jgi:hypothetical protein
MSLTVVVVVVVVVVAEDVAVVEEVGVVVVVVADVVAVVDAVGVVLHADSRPGQQTPSAMQPESQRQISEPIVTKPR